MKTLIPFTCLLMLISLTGCETIIQKKSDVISDNDYAATSQFYASMIKDDKPETSILNLFFTNMPKGGDLHHHYSGSIYAETYLDWVKKKGYRIDPISSKIITNSMTAGVSVDELLKNDTAYRQLLMRWSDKDFDNHFHNQPPPDVNFFNTFGYFGDISDAYMDVGLNIIKKRAINENVRYIESMLTSVGVSANEMLGEDQFEKANNALKQNRHNPDEAQKIFSKIYQELTSVSPSAKKYNKKIAEFVLMVEKNHEGIDTENFTMRYQTYGVRVRQPAQVFVDLLSGYLAANATELIVGVNIVAPENNVVALEDYELHMQMFRFFREKYPNVNRSLHAGELTLGMVRPKDLLFHMTQAIEIAGAQRIGHGIDLPYEKNPLHLLNQLKEKSAVE
ncbi:MAG: adenosine deaminase, partial [Gammaproteobacteria bacterium]|nr:adenosine deaminase [Gammaproteobacteria bacterium]